MAQVTQRIWESGPRKVKRAAWGFTAQRDGKQVRRFREDWTKDDAERAFSEWTLGAAPAGAEPIGMTLGMMLEKFLDARGKSKRNKSAVDDRERSRPLLAFFGKDTPLSAITTARVADYRAAPGGDAFRSAVKRAGLETADRARRVTFHTLRHSFASLYAQRTGDLLLTEDPRPRIVQDDGTGLYAVHTGLRGGRNLGARGTRPNQRTVNA
jgi:hypothetical protein